MLDHTLEIIPINTERIDRKEIVNIHLSRLRQLDIAGEKIEKIIYLIFSKEKEDVVLDILKSTLEFIGYEEPETFNLSLEYPLILRDINLLRDKLEKFYFKWEVYLNISPLIFHIHAAILRDGLISDKYSLKPYEVLNVGFKEYDYVIIPTFFQLNLIDLKIMDRLIEVQNQPINLKEFIQLEALGWDKSMSTYDQKMRNRLNSLVERGLLDFKIGKDGQKLYKLKLFKLERYKKEP